MSLPVIPANIGKTNTTLGELAKELGFDPSMARLVPVDVQVEVLDPAISDALLAKMASEGLQEAAGPITESGKPRMLKLTAWIAHAGKANRNRDAFVEEDLEALANDGLFAPPYLGMVDFNHDFFPYGAWYSARYEYDPKAGEFGLLAEGTMFAWRFTEMADKILAEQSRNGKVAVSMACIAQAIEWRKEDDIDISVLRKPVFLAVSVLDVPGADPHARAVGDEHEDSDPEERLRELNKALLSIHAADGDTFEVWRTAFLTAKTRETGQTITQEETMDEKKIIAALTEAFGEKATEMLDEIKSAVADAAKVPGLEADVVRLSAELETAIASLDTANTTNEEVQAELETAQTALTAATDTMATMQETIESVTAERDELVGEKTAAAKETLKETRLARLPEAFVKALEAREEESRNKVIARLVELTDEDFDSELEVLEATFSKAGYTERSKVEGTLSTGAGSSSDGGYAIDQFTK